MFYSCDLSDQPTLQVEHMRIFTAVRHSNEPTYYYGGLWSWNFYPALREPGHGVVESEVAPEGVEVRAQTTERFFDVLLSNREQTAVLYKDTEGSSYQA